MRIDNRQRFIKQDRIDIGPHQSAAKRDLLLAVCRQAGCTIAECGGKIIHFRHFPHPLVHGQLGYTAIA